MHLRSRLLEQPWVYGAFHALLSRGKFHKLEHYLKSHDTTACLKVLDVGCGPGTNAFLFEDAKKYDYLGVDINDKYIETASARYGMRFLCMNVSKLSVLDERYDIILINSVTHHLTEAETKNVLASAGSLLSPDGHCIVMDMVRPAGQRSIQNSLQRLLIFLDRGRHCRTESELRELLQRDFSIEDVSRFEISFFGVTLWDLRMFTAKSRQYSRARD